MRDFRKNLDSDELIDIFNTALRCEALSDRYID